jgi:hypothetical protein
VEPVKATFFNSVMTGQGCARREAAQAGAIVAAL